MHHTARNARSSALSEAKNLTTPQLRKRIAQAEAAPIWRGDEFGDVRMRHMAATRIRTLREVLTKRLTEQEETLNKAADVCDVIAGDYGSELAQRASNYLRKLLEVYAALESIDGQQTPSA